MGAHRRRVRLRSRRGRCWTARPTGAGRASMSPARSSRCCPRRCPGAPARSSPGRIGLRSRPSSCSTARASAAASFYRSVIRSDERLDYERVDRIFDGRERASPGAGARRSRWRGRRPPRSRSGGSRRRRCRSSPPSRSSSSTAGERGLGRAGRADRVPSADRASDDRRERAGGAAVGVAAGADAVPSARAARRDRRRAADRSARVARGADPAGSQGAHRAAAGRRSDRRGLAADRAVDRVS